LQETEAVFIVGDIHGYLHTLVKLLQGAGLINHAHNWIGRNAALWFIGDLVDRGSDSIGVLNLVMRLQEEAHEAGGSVDCLLGNHELLLLAAYQFGRRSTGLSSNFITKWRRNGGNKNDLAKLTKAHLTWLAERPGMSLVGNTLLVHADATFYTRYGKSVAEVNETFRTLLKRSDALAWEELIEAFAMRGIFVHKEAGDEFVSRFLSIFGGERIIHGHTPISTIVGGSAKKVTGSYVYANGRCIDVDGGIYMGGPGFVYRLETVSDEKKQG
jgi:hypothetical protein